MSKLKSCPESVPPWCWDISKYSTSGQVCTTEYLGKFTEKAFVYCYQVQTSRGLLAIFGQKVMDLSGPSLMRPWVSIWETVDQWIRWRSKTAGNMETKNWPTDSPNQTLSKNGLHPAHRQNLFTFNLKQWSIHKTSIPIRIYYPSFGLQQDRKISGESICKGCFMLKNDP